MKCLRCLARSILTHPHGSRRKCIARWAAQYDHDEEELKARIIDEHKAQMRGINNVK